MATDGITDFYGISSNRRVWLRFWIAFRGDKVCQYDKKSLINILHFTVVQISVDASIAINLLSVSLIHRNKRQNDENTHTHDCSLTHKRQRYNAAWYVVGVSFKTSNIFLSFLADTLNNLRKMWLVRSPSV